MTTALSLNVEYSVMLTFIWAVGDSFIWSDKERFTCKEENAFICTDDDSSISWVELSRIPSPFRSEEGDLSFRNVLMIEKIHFNEMIKEVQLECHNINYQILCFVVQCEFQKRRGEKNIVMMYYRRNFHSYFANSLRCLFSKYIVFQTSLHQFFRWKVKYGIQHQ